MFILIVFLFPMAQESLVGLNLLIIERLHDHTLLDTPRSVGLLRTSDQPGAETSS
jgi:hypothetical protein